MAIEWTGPRSILKSSQTIVSAHTAGMGQTSARTDALVSQRETGKMAAFIQTDIPVLSGPWNLFRWMRPNDPQRSSVPDRRLTRAALKFATTACHRFQG